MSKLKIVITLFIIIDFQWMAVAQEIANNSISINSENQHDIGTLNKFGFKPLPYAYDALEPFIDKLTVDIHYNRHHRAYYINFMKAIQGTEMESMEVSEILRNIGNYPTAVRNNGGGYFNHTFYWESLKAKGGGLPTGKLSEALSKTFGSFEEFKKQLSDAAKTRLGSGWAWLCLDDNNTLFIFSTANQDNPLMDIAEKKGTPLLTIDVWEHAYYLKYQNKRPDYIDAFWNLVNWEEVDRRYEKAMKSSGVK